MILSKKNEKTKLSILIPAYNEEKTIGQVLTNVLSVKTHKLEKEIIVIDDGSSDGTANIVEKFASREKNILLFKHDINSGKGAAVQTGIKKAKGDIILIQDADLEYDPNDIPRLILPIVKKDTSVVYGTRLKMKPVFFGKNKTPFLLHFFGNKFLSLITSILYGATVSDMETGYKVFETRALRGIILKAKSFDFEPEITAKLLKKGFKIHELNITTKPRGYDEGKKIHTFKDGSKALWTLLKYRVMD